MASPAISTSPPPTGRATRDDAEQVGGERQQGRRHRGQGGSDAQKRTARDPVAAPRILPAHRRVPMPPFTIVAVLLTLAALFAYLNYRFLKLPTTIGIMTLALATSRRRRGAARGRHRQPRGAGPDAARGRGLRGDRPRGHPVVPALRRRAPRRPRGAAPAGPRHRRPLDRRRRDLDGHRWRAVLRRGRGRARARAARS